MIILLWFIFGFILGNYVAVKLIDYGIEGSKYIKQRMIDKLVQDDSVRDYLEKSLDEYHDDFCHCDKCEQILVGI